MGRLRATRFQHQGSQGKQERGRGTHLGLGRALTLLLVEVLGELQLRAHVLVVGAPDGGGADVQQGARGGEAGGVEYEDVGDGAGGAEAVPECIDGRRGGDVAGDALDDDGARGRGLRGEALRRGGEDVCPAAEDDNARGRGLHESLRDPVADARAAAGDHDRAPGLGQLGPQGTDGGVGTFVD